MTRLVSLYNGSVNLEFNKAKHAYMWGDKFIPGVTSILKLLDKPALVQWSANMACQWVAENWRAGCDMAALLQEAKTAHRRFARDAADIGTQVHKFAEQALVDRRVTMPTDPQARLGAEAFLGWLHKHKPEPIDCERIVFSREWWFAGTCDMYGHVDGELCVVDLKTSSGLYLEMILQLAAYAVALEEETGETINKGWIVRLDKKTGKCEPYPIPLTKSYGPPGERISPKDAFLWARRTHELVTKIDGDLDGLRKSAA